MRNDWTTTNSDTPVEVLGAGGSGDLSGIVAVAGAYLHSLAARSDGTVWAWGDNGTTTGSTTPVQMSNLSGVTAAVTTPYQYDGDGLRAHKMIGSTTINFAWDFSQGLLLLLTDGSAMYVYGPGGLPIEQVDSQGNVLYLHADQLGSTRLLTDPTGAVVATYTYDAYGNTTAKTGTASTAFQFAGQYQDSETGAYYLQARYYDPGTGQFLSRDPLADLTRAPFNYGADSPLDIRDRSGLPGSADVSGGASATPCSWSETVGMEAIGSFALVGQTDADQMPLGEQGPEPKWYSGGSLSTNYALSVGTLYVAVDETVSDGNTNLALWISASCTSPDIKLSPEYTVSGGVPPYAGSSWSFGGYMGRYNGPAIVSGTGGSVAYNEGIDIPSSKGRALQVSITANIPGRPAPSSCSGRRRSASSCDGLRSDATPAPMGAVNTGEHRVARRAPRPTGRAGATGSGSSTGALSDRGSRLRARQRRCRAYDECAGRRRCPRLSGGRHRLRLRSATVAAAR